MTEPKIRFKRDDGSSFPDWEEKTLDDIATRVTRKNSNNETDIPLTISSLDGLVDQRTYFGKTVASKDMSGYFLLKNGEFAYNKSYSVGYDYGSIKRLDNYEQGALSTLYICFSLNDNRMSDYMVHYFNSLVWNREMPKICAEGARNHGLLNVSPADFFKINVSLPVSIEEQQKIADFLSNVDEVIVASEEEVANLEQQKKAVMQKIFSQEVRFKKEDGSDFPDWEEKMLGEAITFVNGRAYKQEELLATGKYLVLRVGNLFTNNEYYYSDLELDDDKYIDNGDLIYAWSATFGPRIYQGEKCIYHYHIWKCLFDDESYSKNFLNQLLLNDVENIKRVQNGFAMMHITKENMGNRVLKIPSLPEQQLIADFLTSYDEAITAAKQELAKWKELKKGLLQQMFV